MNPFHQLNFVELMEPIQPADIFSITSRLAPKTGRISTKFLRKILFRKNLVTEKIGNRNLRCRYRKKRTGNRFVHLPFFVRKLAGRRCTRFVDKKRSEEHTSELQSRGHLV